MASHGQLLPSDTHSPGIVWPAVQSPAQRLVLSPWRHHLSLDERRPSLATSINRSTVGHGRRRHSLPVLLLVVVICVCIGFTFAFLVTYARSRRGFDATPYDGETAMLRKTTAMLHLDDDDDAAPPSRTTRKRRGDPVLDLDAKRGLRYAALSLEQNSTAPPQRDGRMAYEGQRSKHYRSRDNETTLKTETKSGASGNRNEAATSEMPLGAAGERDTGTSPSPHKTGRRHPSTSKGAG